MSETKRPEPDEELLEFLGDMDEANELTGEENFADFLAGDDADGIAEPPPPKAPPGDKKHE